MPSNNDHPAGLSLWFATAAAEPQQVALGASAWLAHGVRPSEACNAAETAVLLQPVMPLDGVIAVGFVGDTVDYLVAVNGTPLNAGSMVGVKPADRIDIGIDSYWLSQDLSPRRTTYSRDQHGADARCCMTKARLKGGQQIVVCPGRPGSPCTVVYRADVWDALAQSREMRCPSCGFRPGQPSWRPPNPARKRKPRHDFRQFVHRESAARSG